MSAETPRLGIVYTETVVHAAPQQWAADAPYQLAIVEFPDGHRRTVRIARHNANDRAHVGDAVEFLEERDGVAYYRKAVAAV